MSEERRVKPTLLTFVFLSPGLASAKNLEKAILTKLLFSLPGRPRSEWSELILKPDDSMLSQMSLNMCSRNNEPNTLIFVATAIIPVFGRFRMLLRVSL